MSRNIKVAAAFNILMIRCSISPAPNEAGGGNWVTSRFRSRAYEALSELCRSPVSTRGLSDDEVSSLEALIGRTTILLEPKDEGNAGIAEKNIWLRRKSWEHFFSANVDVYPRVVELYLTLLGKPNAAEVAGKLDYSRLVTHGLFPFNPADPGKNLPLLKLGDCYWKAIPGPFPREAAVAQCDRSNTLPAFSRLAVWKMPEPPELNSMAPSLLRYVDSLPYKSPSSYSVWMQDGSSVFDLEDAREVPPAAAGSGVLCEGR